MLLLRALQFINLFTAAIVAGGQLAVLLVVVPTKRAFEPRISVLVHNAMLGHQIDRYMKPSGITSMLTALAIVALHAAGAGHGGAAPVVSTLVGIAGTLGVAITSRYFNVPVNRMMLGWSLGAIPEGYAQVRRRWDLVHTIRSSCGVLALTSYLIAALAS